MSEKDTNRQVLEKIAKEILHAETQEEIDAFVATFLYGALII